MSVTPCTSASRLICPSTTLMLRMLLLCAQYPLCVSLLDSGAVDVKPMITHRFGFSADQIAAGFDTAVRSRDTGAIKVMFNL